MKNVKIIAQIVGGLLLAALGVLILTKIGIPLPPVEEARLGGLFGLIPHWGRILFSGVVCFVFSGLTLLLAYETYQEEWNKIAEAQQKRHEALSVQPRNPEPRNPNQAQIVAQNLYNIEDACKPHKLEQRQAKPYAVMPVPRETISWEFRKLGGTGTITFEGMAARSLILKLLPNCYVVLIEDESGAANEKRVLNITHTLAELLFLAPITRGSIRVQRGNVTEVITWVHWPSTSYPPVTDFAARVGQLRLTEMTLPKPQ
jgi:hypothetical protein